mgnify:CR=1 FL=1
MKTTIQILELIGRLIMDVVLWAVEKIEGRK